MYAIGIDVGGSRTRVAAIDDAGRIRDIHRHPTPWREPPGRFVRLLAQWVAKTRPDDRPTEAKGIGLAVPGILDHVGGVIVRAVNLPHLEGFPLAARLAEMTSLPVKLLSDADAATWGEYSCQLSVIRGQGSAGSIQDSAFSTPHSFVHLRIGTGIACGWVKDGCLQSIEPNRTGHLNMQVIDDSPNAGPCRCGKRGCLDTVASGYVLSQRCKQLGFRDGLPELERAYGKGHAGATTLVTEAAEALSKAITNIADGLHPEVISLGGGVLAVLPSIQEKTFRCLEAVTPPAVAFHPSCRGLPAAAGASVPSSLSPHRPLPILAPALLGDNAGLVGAADLVMQDKSTKANRGT